MTPKKKEEEKPTNLVSKRQIEQDAETIHKILTDSKVDADQIETIKLEIAKEIHGKFEAYKDQYHKYQQTGRFFSSTKFRRPKKSDFVCLANMEHDTVIVEKLNYYDANLLGTKSFKYPFSLTKSIEMKVFSLNPIKKVTVHFAIADIQSSEIAHRSSELADSVFLSNILKYDKERSIKDKPLLQMLIAGGIFGIVLYFSLVQVFAKVIISIIGDLTLNPPSE